MLRLNESFMLSFPIFFQSVWKISCKWPEGCIPAFMEIRGEKNLRIFLMD